MFLSPNVTDRVRIGQVQGTYQVRTIVGCKIHNVFQCTRYNETRAPCTWHVHRLETRVLASRHVYQLRDTCTIFETRVLASRHVYCCETRLSALLVRGHNISWNLAVNFLWSTASILALFMFENSSTLFCVLLSQPLYIKCWIVPVVCNPSRTANVAGFQQISDGKY